MSDGTINLPKRATAPGAPASGRYRIYVDQNDNEVKYIDDAGLVQTFKGDQGDQGIQGAQGDQGIQGAQGPQGPMNVEAFISETATVTLPNTTTATVVYSDTINFSGVGDAFVDISLAVRNHSNNNDMEFFVRFDGVILTPEYIEEHKDNSAAQSLWRAQCFDLGNVSAGNHTLELLFSKEQAGGTAQLKNYTAKVVRYS